MVETVEIQIQGGVLPVEVRPNARAKRLQFRLDPKTGHVLLTLPRGMRPATGLDFVRTKAAWIAPRRAKILAGLVRLTPGTAIPIDGQMVPIVEGRGARLDEAGICLPQEAPEKTLATLLKARAKARLTPLAHAKAATLGLPIARLTYRDTRTRWGSCSAQGHISLNFRIMCADPLCQDYLVAHEVAHLAEPHHQPAFWAQCAQLMAQPQAMDEARARLKAIGTRLMALPLG